MAFSPTKLTRQSSVLMLPAVAKLAYKRARSTAGLLCMTWLGMVTMLVLVCVIPLFSRVAGAASLLDLARSAEGKPSITLTTQTDIPAATQMQPVQKQLDQLIHSALAPYLAHGDAQLALKTPDLQILHPTMGAVDPQNQLSISSFASSLVPHNVTLVQGRLPRAADDAIEIAVSRTTATALGLHPGSLMQVRFPLTMTSNPITWKLRVVGIIAVQPNAGNIWRSQLFEPISSNDPDQFDGIKNPGNNTALYNALASQDVLLPAIQPIRLNPVSLGMIEPAHIPAQPRHAASGGGNEQPFFTFSWRYTLDPAHVTVDDASTLVQRYQQFQIQLYSSGNVGSASFFDDIRSPFLESLQTYTGMIAIAQVGVTLLLIVILGLALFTVNLLSTMLVERQAATLAMLRSRGATRRHILGTFVAQGLGLSLLALLVAPVLAWLLVATLTRLLIAPLDFPALSSLTNDPLHALSQISWYALVTVLVAWLTLILAVRRATRFDIVTLRQEASRSTRKPFWKRLYLDVLLVILVGLGYAFYLYLNSLPAQVHESMHFIAAPLAYAAAPAVLVALALICLRLFPLCLRLGLKLAASGKRAPAQLAFAQMERQPRAVSSLVLLLVVALAGSFYLLSFLATTQARAADTTAFQVGADFSGPIVTTSSATPAPSDLEAPYRSQAGVLAATVGYRADIEQTTNFATIHIAAIDADTYAQAADWLPQYSTQPLAELTSQLVAHRTDAASRNVVYTWVDASMWEGLHLTPGEEFSLPVPGYAQNRQMHFIALGKINTIPGFNDSPSFPFFGAGLLADYQSYATVYAKDNASNNLLPNYVWLHTSDDATRLRTIRHTWPGLQDRRAMQIDVQASPLQVNVLGTLEIGIATALVLALLGTLLTTWISTASRLTNFALLRALGMASREIAAMLFWEQGVIYLVALLLGTSLGYALTVFVAPAYSLFDNVGAASLASNSISEVLPIHTLIPTLPIGLLLLGVTLLCLGALALTTRVATRPSLAQTLRLNED